MRNLTMMTDFYQLTMANGYFQNDEKNVEAVFDLFFREHEKISYCISAGLEQAVEYLLNLEFTDSDIEYLGSLGYFAQNFLDYLKTFKFTGDLYAMPEGTIVFPNEPILTIKAPIIEAQIVETALLTIINHQTLIATKTAKVKSACGSDTLLEFGLRRAQGADAGNYGARAAMIGGADGTANVYVAKKYNLDPKGTHSHSWVMSFDSEIEAFREYARLYPDKCLLLVDTYDTLASGVPNAIKVFDELKAKGYAPVGIRLDSGDLAYLSKKARTMLDDAGYKDVKICASSDLDEHLIMSLKQQGGKIDMWGVGTKMITSFDLPALGGVYKMSAISQNGKLVPKIKVSNNLVKITNPALKTVQRIYNKDNGKAIADVITLKDEKFDGSPMEIFHPVETWKRMVITDYTIRDLHETVISGGALAKEQPTFTETLEYAKRERESIWEEYKRLYYPEKYKVDLSEALHKIKSEILQSIAKKMK
ncbi:MAG: nicotinate phosphoribosyltransferase [Bacillota bacterium]